ncbi:MAG: glycosyltransferase, partial [Segetibacter sp.]
MKSIRVLHVVAGMDPKMGGVSKAVRMIIAGLNECNINSETVSLDAPDAHYLEADSFSIHAVGIGKTPWAYNNKLFNWLQENLEKFDVVIVHGLW